MALARELFGLPVPQAGPLFDVALACHIAAALTAVVAGALAATGPKRPGRHPRAGRVYLGAIAVVFASSTTMAVLRLAHDWHLLLIGTGAFGAACLGYLARRRRRPGWLRVHIPAMGASYVTLLTGFYVDNGPSLPVWERLPHLAYWVLPAMVGVPLIVRAMRRRRLLGFRPASRVRPRTGARHGRPG